MLEHDLISLDVLFVLRKYRIHALLLPIDSRQLLFHSLKLPGIHFSLLSLLDIGPHG